MSEMMRLKSWCLGVVLAGLLSLVCGQQGEHDDHPHVLEAISGEMRHQNVMSVRDDSLSYTISDDQKTLTITGTGPMADYDEKPSSKWPPWTDYSQTVKTVVIDEGVTSIGDYGFVFMDVLEEVHIPSTVTSIGYRAFYQCPSLSSIVVADDNQHFASDDGVLFNHDYTTLVCFPPMKGPICTIPKTVTSLVENVFLRCVSFTSINVEEGNVAYASINGVLFDRNCTTLIAYPAGRTDTYYIIPDNVTTIDVFAFSEASSLKSVVIPDSVTSIHESTFNRCYNLESVYYEGLSSIFDKCLDPNDNNRNLKDVCVLDGYTNKFCFQETTNNNEACVTFRNCFSLSNECYKYSCIDGKTIERKRKAVEDWESQTHGCVVYTCDNDNGLYGPVFLACNEPPECHSVDGECNEVSGECEYQKMNIDRWNELKEQESVCKEVKCNGTDWTLEDRQDVIRWKERTNGCYEYYCDDNEGMTNRTTMTPAMREQENECYEYACHGGSEWVLEKTRAALEWESRTEGCNEYLCDNVSGNIKHTCVHVLVDVEPGIHREDFDKIALISAIENFTGIRINDMEFECDDEGNVIRVIIYTNSEEERRTVVGLLYEIMCETEATRMFCDRVRIVEEDLSGTIGRVQAISTVLLFIIFFSSFLQ